MAAIRKYNIWQGPEVKVIGYIHWNIDEWDYHTDNSELSHVLGQIKSAGEILGFDSFDEEEYIQDFVEKTVKTTDPTFIPNLSDYLGLAMVNSETPSIWIMPKRKK